MELKQRIEQTVSLDKGDQSQFSVPDIVAGLVVASQTGVVRSKQLSRLVPEVKLAESIGRPHFFGATTASDLMKQAQPRHIKEMNRLLRGICLEAVLADAGPEIDIVVDTTGHPSDSRHREGVAVGYCNGRKEPGLKSGRVVINGRRRGWISIRAMRIPTHPTIMGWRWRACCAGRILIQTCTWGWTARLRLNATCDSCMAWPTGIGIFGSPSRCRCRCRRADRLTSSGWPWPNPRSGGNASIIAVASWR
jgi:hypothetical protein